MSKSRSRTSKFEVSDRRRITFYPAVFDQETQVMDYGMPGSDRRERYREVIRPGSFQASLRADADVIANLDHDPNKTFARRSDGSLLLQEDPHGLFASAWLPETELGEQILKGVKDGVITGASFKFVPTKERWTSGLCEVEAVELEDVCVTCSPAYAGTEVHLRTKAYLAELWARYSYAKYKATRTT